MLRNFHLFCLTLICLLALTNYYAVKGNGMKIVIVTPFCYRSHYELHKTLALALAPQDWVQKVLLLIPDLITRDEKASLSTFHKLRVESLSLRTTVSASAGKLSLKEWEDEGSTLGINGIHRLEEPAKYLRGSESEMFIELYKNADLVSRLQADHFDVGIGEVFFPGAIHFLGLIRVRHLVLTSAMPLMSVFYEFMGFLDAIKGKGDIPELWSTKYNDHKVVGSMKAFNRLHEISVHNTMENFHNFDKKIAEICGQIYGHHQGPPPTFRQLFNKRAQLLVNTQPMLDFPMPSGFPERVAFFGGISMQPQNNVGQTSAILAPQEQAAIAAVSEPYRKRKGLVLVSFGTLSRMEEMPERKFRALLSAFKQLDAYEFLWKFDCNPLNDNGHGNECAKRLEEVNKAGNIRTRPYLNQIQLLANPQCRLFISHCGMNSVIESATLGVPLLCIPLFADQFYNAEALAKHELAHVLAKDAVYDVDHVLKGIREVLENSSYTQNMKEVKVKLAQTRPLETFLNKIHELL